MLIENVVIPEGYQLRNYSEYVYLAPHVTELQALAQSSRAQLANRTIWIVSSTRRGGGVSEGLLADDKEREVWGRNARDRVSRDFLLFSELRHWLRLLAEVASRPEPEQWARRGEHGSSNR